jgi:hypothetical protein
MNSKKKKLDLYQLIPPAILVFLFFGMLAWSWRKWPDVLIDFGRELYIPSQINQGQVLYKDLAHLFGPFSSYFNAFLFKVFGTSFLTLIISNTVILALFLMVLYIVLSKITSRIAAFMSCFVVMTVFSFSQYTLVGNYNFISPYSHEAIHGLILSLLMIYLLYCFLTTENKCNLIFAGFILGIVFLTKAEVFLAAFVTALFFFFIYFCKKKNNLKLNLKLLCLFTTVALLPAIGYILYFGTAMPFSDAFKAIINPYTAVLNVKVVSTDFYIRNMGFDNVERNILKIIAASSITIFLIIIALLSSYYLPKCIEKPEMKGLCIIGLLLPLGITFFYVKPYNAGIPLPILDIVSFCIILTAYFKLPKTCKEDNSWLALLMLSVFSIFLLLKIAFNCRIFHYGFYLALPSVMLTIIMLIYFIPELLKRKSSGYTVFRNIMIMVIITIVGKYIFLSNQIYQLKTFSVGEKHDKIITYIPRDENFRGYLVDQALDWLSFNVDKDKTFVVLPEGIIMNYLTKRKNPTKYTNFMLPELLTFGEDNILKEFKSNSPDYIVLIHRLPSNEYGVGYFGENSNYGKKIMDWVNNNYQTCILLGAEPFKSKKFGIKILKENIIR